MKKRLLISSLLIVLTIVLFAIATSAQAIDWKQCNGETINLLMNKHTYTNSVSAITDEFTKLTGIKVNIYALSQMQFYEKQKIFLASGSDEYDITMTGPEDVWENEDFLIPLDSFINDSQLTEPAWDFDDFYPGLIESNRILNKLYSIPVMVEGYLYHYRKDLFDKYGLTVPTTMDEWIDTTAKLRKALDEDGKQDMDALMLRGQRAADTIFIVAINPFYAAGGRDFDENKKCVLNSPVSVKFHEDYIKLIKTGCSKDWANTAWYDVKDGLTSGKAASAVDCNFFAAEQWDPEVSQVVGKMAYAPVPDVEISSVWTWGLSIPKGSKHQKAAWLFIQWSSSKDVLLDAALNYNNFDPTRISVRDGCEEMLSQFGNYAEVDGEMIKNARVLPTVNPRPFAFFEMWAVALQEMWIGADVKETLDSLTRKVDEARFFD